MLVRNVSVWLSLGRDDREYRRRADKRACFFQETVPSSRAVVVRADSVSVAFPGREQTPWGYGEKDLHS